MCAAFQSFHAGIQCGISGFPVGHFFGDGAGVRGDILFGLCHVPGERGNAGISRAALCFKGIQPRSVVSNVMGVLGHVGVDSVNTTGHGGDTCGSSRALNICNLGFRVKHGNIAVLLLVLQSTVIVVSHISAPFFC